MTARSELQPGQLSRLGELLARCMGLNFPPDRWADLQRGMAAAAHEFGFEHVDDCAAWLASAPLGKSQLQVLAAHLTIGETYFFRDPEVLGAVATKALPALIRARSGTRRLRIWSAACSSGEEPYSLAMLLREAVPELGDWDVRITATDINPRALEKAAAGSYGAWSFRGAPADLKARYFHRGPDGRHVVAPEIKRMVTFTHLNLVDDAYTGAGFDAGAMDLVFCRNVLMYFTPPQALKVVGNVRRSLADGGWLVVSPSEASHALFPGFAAEYFPGAILFRKGAPTPSAQQRWTPPPDDSVEYVPDACAAASPPQGEREMAATMPSQAYAVAGAAAESLYREGRYAETVEAVLGAAARRAASGPEFSLLTRALANLGRLDEALGWSERWIAADKLDRAGHYLRAMILLEQGRPEAARSSLRRAIYLDPDFVLAHAALGNVARAEGNAGEAARHVADALEVLRRTPPDELVPESDGLTAGRLRETFEAMLAVAALP